MMIRVSYLLSILSGAIVLLTLNRKTTLTQGLLQPYEFLRWQDFHAMVTLPLLITAVYTFLFIRITQRQTTVHKNFGLFFLVFAVGALLYGVSSGNHEVTNYLHHRYCMPQSTSICQIISYNDDTFSHIIFYLSSILMTSALLFFERVQPEPKPLSNRDLGLLFFNALLIGLGLFINLAFENLGIDLYAFGLLSAISLYLLWTKRKEFLLYPIISYSALGYGFGTVASVLYKLFTS